MTLLSWLAAFLLDWRLGDPEHWPHPIRWIGNAIRLARHHLDDLHRSCHPLFTGCGDAGV